MNDAIISSGYWFRYTGSVEQNFENKASKMQLAGRAIYALYQDKASKLWILPSDLSDKYPLDHGTAELLIQSSKPFTGKHQGKSVQPGSASFAETFAPSKEKPAVKPPAASELVLPKISGSASLSIVPITGTITTKIGVLLVPSDRIFDMVQKSIALIGTKVKFKRDIKIAVSTSMSTCLLSRKNPQRGRLDIYIVLNLRQLGSIFGTLTVKNLAQVLTHELGHYIMEHGVMKQTDLLKFKKAIASKNVHQSQFLHPGYSYAWWREAWAILCEAMVHGQSVRGFSTEIGYEIAEKYFSNLYIKDGVYRGSYREH